MTREFFNQQFAALVSAYTMAQKLPNEGQDVYWIMLKGIPEGKFAAGVKKCLVEMKFFPTIHELGEASLPPKQRTFKSAGGRFVTYTQHWQDQITDSHENAPKLIEEF